MKIYESGAEAKDKFKELYGNVTLPQLERYDSLLRWFERSYNKKGAYLCSSSGRVELIGNHTDHNGGRVVGCTISLDVLCAFLPNCDNVIRIKSKGYSDIVLSVDDTKEKEATSRGMVKGILKGFKDRGYKTGGFDACMTSDVAGGAGISSSAAFEMLIAETENALYNEDKIDPVTLAEISKFSENEYFGKPCGLSDQGVIALGGIVKLDFKDKTTFEKIDNPLKELGLVLVDTGGSHAALTEHYAAIPAEMKKVAKIFGCDRLIDVDETEFFRRYEEIAKITGERPALRAKHFFEENRRVDAVGECLKKFDYAAEFLSLLNESGRSSLVQLQNCGVAGGDNLIPESLERAAKVCQGGAFRVHGGGFAGTVLCVVPKTQVSSFAESMSKFYPKERIFPLKVRTRGTVVL